MQALYSNRTLQRFRFPDWQETIRVESNASTRVFTESLGGWPSFSFSLFPTKEAALALLVLQSRAPRNFAQGKQGTQRHTG